MACAWLQAVPVGKINPFTYVDGTCPLVAVKLPLTGSIAGALFG